MFSLFYKDLNGNGHEEMIRCKTGLSSAAIVIQEGRSGSQRQYNLGGSGVVRSEVKTLDLDHDGCMEILAFTMLRDSIRLHLIER